MNTSETPYRTYARVAGFTFLFYIVAGISGMALPNKSQVADLLNLLLNFSAIVLGVTLFMITREQGPGLALLALACRVMEAVHSESAIFFAVGSTLFCWLLLRGRMIPVALAWLGVLASVLWVVGLPLQLIGVLPDSVTWFIYLPMAAFEIPFALWLIIKGVAISTPNAATPRAVQVS
jgi:hypothetical protein